MNNEIIVSAGKIKDRKKLVRIIKLILLFMVLLLLILYVVISVVYNNGNFSITMDKNLYLENDIVIYDDPNYKVFRTELFAKGVESFDNISYKWLPVDIDNNNGGSHNGDNYIVYTFFIENMGDKVSDYYSEVIIDDVIKKLDEAVRIRVYKNGVPVTYAKISSSGNPEPNTVPFESETIITKEHVENFAPGNINKYTIVLWLEGTDPECTDNILGGEIKLYMSFNSEFVE